MSGLILGISGLAITATTTGMSFAQAANEKRKSDEANRKAAEMAVKAAQRFDVNVMDELSISKEPYELEREALITQGATALSQFDYDPRSAAGAAGRVQLAMNKGQAGIRADQSMKLDELEEKSAIEQGRLMDLKFQMELGEIEGAQLAAAASDEFAARAEQQAFQGVANMAQQGMSLVPLYSQQTGAQKNAMAGAQSSTKVATKADVDAGLASKVGESFSTNPYEGMKVRQGESKLFNRGQQEYFGKDIGSMDFNTMSNRDFRQFKRAVGKENQGQLFNNPYYTNAYQNPFDLEEYKKYLEEKKKAGITTP